MATTVQEARQRLADMLIFANPSAPATACPARPLAAQLNVRAGEARCPTTVVTRGQTAY
jgi:hypothetical protein